MRSPTITLKRARRMRRALTPPELALWSQLKGGKLEGLHFRRQHPAGPYILDFYCSEARLAVEIDGQGHGHEIQAAHDSRRDNWLEAQGIEVLRTAAQYVKGDLSPVLGLIRDTAARRIAAGLPVP
jgi:very-short-patch-repair endonuclease